MTQASPPPLPLIFSITITGILANTLVGPAIPDILEAFDQPDSRAGLFVAAGTLPGIVMAPVIGVLADRFGRRAVLVPCLVAFGTFGLLSALAPTFPIAPRAAAPAGARLGRPHQPRGRDHRRPLDGPRAGAPRRSERRGAHAVARRVPADRRAADGARRLAALVRARTPSGWPPPC